MNKYNIMELPYYLFIFNIENNSFCVKFLNGTRFLLVDGHSGLVLPGPIPNPAVKQANVLCGTVL